MTSLNSEDVCRKSSVYNQTGQSYFQQLTAYNHMSAHLRRLLLAPSVVDARNKKYTRERDKRQQRLGWTCPCRSKTRRNLIEGLVYDTKHHPIDVLKMNFKCSPGCRFKDSRASTRLSNLRQGQGQGHRQGQGRREQDANKSGRGSTIEHSQTRGSQTPMSNAEPSYNNSYEKQYESHGYSDSEFDSPVEVSESVDAPPPPQDIKQSGKHERQTEEAKYAKFIYEITQEIMINGLYTDEELQAIFNKHIHMNSNILDIDRMQTEIDQLRTSLNLTQLSDDEEEEEEDIERFVASGKFATFSPLKPPTPPKVLDRDKLADKIRQESTRFDEIRKQSGDSHNGRRNSVVLVDANPELLLTERDLLVTLMEMKLDPQQVANIRKSLRNKSRDTALTKTVDAVDTFHSRKQEDRAISPIIWRPEARSTQFSHTRFNGNRRDETTAAETPEQRDRTELRKAPHCECRCRRQDNAHFTSDDNFKKRDIGIAPKVEREVRKEQDDCARSEITSMKSSKSSFQSPPRNNDRKNRRSLLLLKNIKQSNTSVSTYDEDHHAKIIETVAKNKSETTSTDISAARSAEEILGEALDETVSSRPEILIKADYVDGSLPDISERSEGTAAGTVDETVTESYAEARQNPTVYKKLERQTANFEMESLSDSSSSEIDEAQIVQELMELSEAEQVKDLEKFEKKSEISTQIENWDSTISDSPQRNKVEPENRDNDDEKETELENSKRATSPELTDLYQSPRNNNDNNMHSNEESLIIREELSEPVSITEDIKIVTESIDDNRLDTEQSDSAQTMDSEVSKDKTRTYVVEPAASTATKQDPIVALKGPKKENGNESPILKTERERPRATFQADAYVPTTTDSDISLANKEAPDDSLEMSSEIPLNVTYELLAESGQFSSSESQTKEKYLPTGTINIQTPSSEEIVQQKSSLTRKLSTAVKNLRERSSRRISDRDSSKFEKTRIKDSPRFSKKVEKLSKNGNCRSDCRGWLQLPYESQPHSTVRTNGDATGRSLTIGSTTSNSENSD